MSIVGLILFLIASVFTFLGSTKSDEETKTHLTQSIKEKNNTIDSIAGENAILIHQNSLLLDNTNKINVTNEKTALSNLQLIEQNKGMIERIGNYQDDIERKNEIIEKLQKEVSNIKEYSTEAMLNMFGERFILTSPLLNGEPMINLSSDLIGLMKQLITRDKNFTRIKSTASTTIAQKVIDRYPYFPFGYYVMAAILYQKKDPIYKILAQKARDILVITTSIEGHNSDHDDVLKAITTTMLKTRSKFDSNE